MGLKNSKYTPEELQHILGYFSIEQGHFSLQPLTAGYINDTFLVFKEHTPLYILQQINHNVFKDVKGLMQNIAKALDALMANDYNTIKLQKTGMGETYVQHSGSYWRLMSYIPESTTFNTTTNTKIAFEAGRIIGKFHLLLKNEKSSVFVDTIPQFHDLNLRKIQFHEALGSAEKSKLDLAKNTLDFAKETLKKLEGINTSDLPFRICHNDTKLNNILFSKASDRALCLIDLDTIMGGYFFYDFGDAIRTIVNTAPEDEQDHDKITFDQTLFNAFVEGLAHNGPFLTERELKSLPLGTAFMPFIHGLRALTDYLNNNIYYKVSYENQNLDRALSLFDFTKKALDQLDFMKEVFKNRLETD
ncbi:phosphotransferase enzyme family protein [Maribacter sp. 2304DJ31-5]|uniref:phosphotransferase enzyme family protein n=1 Tax=Maribacter sp. 2304DJ31-5 TaxID=3386273 RepID=UPI0039BC3A33